MKRRIPAAVVLILLLALASAAEETWRPFEAAAPQIRPRLEELAAWCREKHLYRERADVWDGILAFDPENFEARRGLGYYRGGDGSWERRDSWRRPRTTREEHQTEFRERRDAILGEFVRETLAGLLDRKLHGPERERILDGLVALKSDDAEVRRVRGEVEVEGRWVLRETASALRRRPEIEKLASGILAAAPAPSDSPLDPSEKRFGMTSAFRSGDARGAGVVPAPEIRETTRLCAAGGDLVRQALGIATRAVFTFYLYEDFARAGEVLRNAPGITQADYDTAARLGSWWVPHRDTVVVYIEEPAIRTEMAVRQAYDLFFRHAFRVSVKQGALHEGLGLYFGHLVTGRRQTWFVRTSEYGSPDADFAAKLREQKRWLDLARDTVRAEGPADYPVLLSVDVNAMSEKDLLHAYAFAAYLVEGDPPGRNAFLRDVGTGKAAADAAVARFGLTLPELSRRVARWLEETDGGE